MREILFRGKQVFFNNWIEGTGIFNDGINTWLSFNEPEKAIACGLNHKRVHAETIGQFTGLTDKNGKKIFEGDIVDASNEWWDASGPAGHNSPKIKVEWDDALCGFDPFANYDCDCGVYINASGCEVIGNIHDNPELLENP